MSIRTSLQSVRRTGLFGAGIMLLFSVGARVAPAQPAAPSAALLKRLAEAVDGYRTGAAVFLVAEVQAPHEVINIFENRADADALVGRMGRAVATFGPFQTERDPGAQLGWFAKCFHWHSSMRDPICPERPVLPFAQLDSVSITVKLKNGTRQVIPVPLGVDAVFFTLSAIDKFAIPYYARVSGADYAARMRQRLVAGLVSP